MDLKIKYAFCLQVGKSQVQCSADVGSYCHALFWLQPTVQCMQLWGNVSISLNCWLISVLSMNQ